MFHKCPGMDIGNFKPEDVNESKCIHCGAEIEFWKDDVKVKCGSCGNPNYNPRLGNTCIVWCKQAAQCVGEDAEEIKKWIEAHKDTCPTVPAATAAVKQ